MELSFDRFYRLNQRILIWIAFFAFVWLLRDFFGLIFIIFIISFMSARFARLGVRYLRLPNWLAITVVHLMFLTAIVTFVRYATPRISTEAETLIGRLGQIESTILDYKSKLAVKYPSIDSALTDYLRGNIPEDVAIEEMQEEAARGELPPVPLAQGKSGRVSLSDEKLIKLFLAREINLIREKAPEYFKLLWQGSATLLLALLFSFLISIDAVRLMQSISSLRLSRLRDFYEQTAQPVVRFAYVVGRAFQAQFIIAILNTILTAGGLIFLGVPSVAFLSLIVFLLSFIPVLGVFISTTPIVLVALNAGGVGTALGVVTMVVIIHLIEAYVLNPLIYGRHMKLNPALVLIILYVGHHSFGVWGMILGVPVAYYLLHDVLGVPLWEQLDKSRTPPPEEPAEAQ
ncbi:AI-2E family transporter [bacterium]|nr:MAG: AI-2E family transporter [bacterium]